MPLSDILGYTVLPWGLNQLGGWFDRRREQGNIEAAMSAAQQLPPGYTMQDIWQHGSELARNPSVFEGIIDAYQAQQNALAERETNFQKDLIGAMKQRAEQGFEPVDRDYWLKVTTGETQGKTPDEYNLAVQKRWESVGKGKEPFEIFKTNEAIRQKQAKTAGQIYGGGGGTATENLPLNATEYALKELARIAPNYFKVNRNDGSVAAMPGFENEAQQLITNTLDILQSQGKGKRNLTAAAAKAYSGFLKEQAAREEELRKQQLEEFKTTLTGKATKLQAEAQGQPEAEARAGILLKKIGELIGNQTPSRPQTPSQPQTFESPEPPDSVSPQKRNKTISPVNKTRIQVRINQAKKQRDEKSIDQIRKSLMADGYDVNQFQW